jgi:site-specific DNA recombinase
MLGAIYARVSTPGQQEEGTSLETQVELCLAFAKDKDLEIPPEFIFQEQGSAQNNNNPMLTQVRHLAKDGRIDAVIILHLDRLSRDAVDQMVIYEEIIEHGVEIFLLNGPVGSSPEDKLVRFVIGYTSEAERRNTRERTMRGKLKTAQNGKMPNGTGPGLYGYKQAWELDDQTGKPKQGRREIIEAEAEAEVVREIFRLALAGKSYHAIAKSLNDKGIPTKKNSKWHPWTIKNMLANSAYMGKTYYGKNRVTMRKNATKREITLRDQSEWTLVEGYTPAVVSEKTFDLAAKRLKEPKSRPGKALYPYLLSGHVTCGYCNASMVGTTLNKKYKYYRCSATYATAARPKHCSAKYVRGNRLEDAVWNAVQEVLENPSVVLSELRRLQNSEETALGEEMERLRKEIRKCRDQEQRLIKLYQFGEVDDGWIKSQSGPVKMMRERFEEELARLDSQMLTVTDLRAKEESMRKYCARVAANISEFDFDEKRLALQSLQIKASATETQVFVKGILGVDGINQAISDSAPSSGSRHEKDDDDFDGGIVGFTGNLATTERTSALRRVRILLWRGGGLRRGMMRWWSPVRFRRSRGRPEPLRGICC